ncbi:MAG: c-type cytochrome, partial [Burkholderiaceae bacterium]
MRTIHMLLTLLALQTILPASPALAIDSIEPQRAESSPPPVRTGVDIEPQSLSMPPLYVQSLAATCANCHGTEGRALSGATIPLLAGRSADELVAQMKAFRSGERKATIMH